MDERGIWGSSSDRLREAAGALDRRTSLKPRFAIVLGSGLGALTDQVTVEATVPYSEIPHFPISTAPGHSGRVILGYLDEQPVALLSGRAHLYEGYTPEKVAFGVRLMCLLGAETLIISNAAGGVNTQYHPGLLMLIADHINLTGQNPLVGPSNVVPGVRFPDMSDAYDAELRQRARRAAKEIDLKVAEGVYLGLLGPSYETPAEIRMARALGADAVGMSTVLEVIAAHHCGMRILGISCITNMAAGILPQKLTEEEVLETANLVRDEFASLVRRFIREYDAEKPMPR